MSDETPPSGDGQQPAIHAPQILTPQIITPSPATQAQGPKLIWAQFKGLFPPPAMMLQYREVIHDLPETMVGEWQTEMTHRRDMDVREQDRADRELDREHTRRIHGMYLGFAALLVGTGVAVYAISAGQGLAGAAIIVSEIAAIAIAFITGRGRLAAPESEQPKTES